MSRIIRVEIYLDKSALPIDSVLCFFTKLDSISKLFCFVLEVLLVLILPAEQNAVQTELGVSESPRITLSLFIQLLPLK